MPVSRPLATVILLVSLVACSVRDYPRRPATASLPITPVRSLTVGLCEDYPEESRSLAAAERDLQLAQTIGAPVLRVAFGWDSIEAQPGHYDWSFWDDFVRLAQQQGVRLIPYVCYTPKWAAVEPDEDSWRRPPRDPLRFGQFMQVISARYRNQIQSWELWNEPDNPHYWLGTPEEFARLLTAGSRGVRAGNPSARVVFGGLAWSLPFFESVMTNRLPAATFDVLNLHNYHETWSDEPLEHLGTFIARARDVLDDHALTNTPLWLAEVGFSSYREGAAVSGQYTAVYRHEHTPEHQAASVVRALTLAAASGQVELAAWYRLHDLPPAQEVIGDVNNRHLGLVSASGEPKPALGALRRMASLFQFPYRVTGRQVLAVQPAQTDVELHAFEFANGAQVVVAWMRTVVPGGRGRAQGNRLDQRRERVLFRLPQGNRSVGQLEILGDPVLRPLHAGEGGWYSLDLSGPQLLLATFPGKNRN